MNASANGFRLASQDGFATARGEAFVATADNASAIYYNPAGITQITGTSLRSGLYSIYVDPTFQPPVGNANAGVTYNIGKHWNFVPQVFFTHSFENSPISVGLGIYAPYGGNIDWPQDTGFRAVALESSLKYFRINPVIAFKLAPNLSLGAGVMVDYGRIDLESGLSSSTRFPDYYLFNGDGWSVGYNFGLLWQPLEQISFGATFRSATQFTMEGHTEFEQLTAGILDTTLPAHADFTFPITSVVGLSYRPTQKWNLEFDADYTDWSSFETTTIYQEGSVPLGGTPNPLITFDWQSSWMYEFGITRYFDNDWHVSAGYVYNENSVPNAYYTPLVADMDRHFFSLGAGRKGERFDFDVAYQFGYGPAHTVTDSTPSSLSGVNSGQNANGTYHFISQAVLVTVGIHF
ncbi:MAG TPA: outer membrane protein transport protein [Candidatus Saccharimonadales bacterium]|nr:outer membrane protein transport protein [Candidatus Saccharimonadales bacterium]